MNLDGDHAFTINVCVGFSIVDGLRAIEPQLDPWTFAADDIFVPILGTHDLLHVNNRARFGQYAGAP